MQINKDDELAGFPILEVRKLLKRADDSLTVEYAAYCLKCPKSSAAQLIVVLNQDGYLEPDGESWLVSVKGAALAHASAAKPLLRSTAQKRLEEFLQRVLIIRDSDAYLCKVSKCVLFGSMLSMVPTVNDIDLGITVVRKTQNYDEFERARKLRIEQLEAGGKVFSSYWDEMFLPEHEVMLFLKNRSRAIALVDYEQNKQVIEAGPHRLLYSDNEQ